ncbi:MAG TPA: hypothetical protein VFZ09_04325 [Archangium sp.]|uniref:hypothetical protein n=1 Tax=Archangium sp. TaxID=1872627 RepID=UPI002E379BE0|nr:hypothetical protein [Archangium sp.]HEX5745446.1 hypothetical protein [Archangium sp.]
MRRIVCALFLAVLSACGDEPRWVHAVPADGWILQDTRPFDLEQRTLRFTPSPEGYTLHVLEGPIELDLAGSKPLFGTWLVELPFAFPFGGTTWKSLFVNPSGSLSFGAPDAEAISASALWPEGGMRTAADLLLARVREGRAKWIVPLWAEYGARMVAVKHEADSLEVTWKAMRPEGSVSYGPRGACIFQAKLFADGTIEFRYQSVPELDGIVGLFAGAAPWDGVSGESDLSAGDAAGGTLYEVFHHPVLSREATTYLPDIYSQHPARDDFVILMTDFRFDGLYAAAASTGAINHPLEGLGPLVKSPRPGVFFGSSALQVAVRPVWVGVSRFDEVVADGRREYGGHAFAVGLLAHELTHRWGVGLEQLEPASGERRPLFGDDCQCHWPEGLHLPAAYSVASLFSSQPYPESSLMGGHSLREEADGTFMREEKPYLTPAGFSWLDLYAMGLARPEEVPDTFLLTDIEELGEGRLAARKVPVTMERIVAAMGPRRPSASEAQREFTLSIYLLHRGKSPDAAAVQRAEAIARSLAAFFEAATGSRLKLTPAH